MSLADAAEQRKARLLALRRKKAGDGGEDGSAESVTISQRNFDPLTRTLRKHDRSDAMDEDDTVEKNVAGMAQEIIASHEETRVQELDLINIVPKRANWDLKRETQKKLAKLERKTQEAIHTLIRQRLAAQKGNDNDLAGALQAQQEADQAEDDSDDE